MKSDGYILMLNLVMMVVLVKKSEGVWLSLHAVGSKCVSEEIHGNVVCLGDYMVEDPQGSHPTISVRVPLNRRRVALNGELFHTERSEITCEMFLHEREPVYIFTLFYELGFFCLIDCVGLGVYVLKFMQEINSIHYKWTFYI